jgi:hypothetical protein
VAFGEAEVHDQDSAQLVLLLEQQVFEFQISVNYAMRVTVANSVEKLFKACMRC